MPRQRTSCGPPPPLHSSSSLSPRLTPLPGSSSGYRLKHEQEYHLITHARTLDSTTRGLLPLTSTHRSDQLSQTLGFIYFTDVIYKRVGLYHCYCYLLMIDTVFRRINALGAEAQNEPLSLSDFNETHYVTP